MDGTGSGRFGEGAAAGRAIVDELRKQTRLLESIEEKVGLSAELLAALTEMQLATRRPPDDLLPWGEEGACPMCACTKVSVPGEEGRSHVRDCGECNHAWRVRPEEQPFEGEVG